MQPARCLLIDDHAMFRSGVAVLLRMGMTNLEVQEAASVDEALHGALTPPDVVLLDIVLRGLSGLDGIELLKRQWPRTPIIMVSSDAEPHTVRLAMARGAAAFVSKEQSADSILGVVRQVLNHTHPTPANRPRPGSQTPPDDLRLTPRQLEVLDLLCQGLPNKAIARKMDLSENTVRWHVQAILAVLNVSNRSEAAFAARSQGLIR